MAPASPRDLYLRWIHELWAGEPVADQLAAEAFVGHWPDREVRGPTQLASVVAETRAMFSEITFTLQVGPIVEGKLVAGRWTGVGTTAHGSMRFFGNDILRVGATTSLSTGPRPPRDHPDSEWCRRA